MDIFKNVQKKKSQNSLKKKFNKKNKLKQYKERTIKNKLKCK
jgi:hypothetical protein